MGTTPQHNQAPIMDEQTLRQMKRLQILTKRKNKFTDFDRIIGHIEDILVDETFHKIQKTFLEMHWTEFSESEENRHEYMEIFTNYTTTIELYITQALETKITNFSMENFITELEKRKTELDGEVFEVLYTLTDFTAFKEMFLDYRKDSEWGGKSFTICSRPIRVKAINQMGTKPFNSLFDNFKYFQMKLNGEMDFSITVVPLRNSNT